MPNPLKDQDLRAMGAAAVEWAASYCGTIASRPILRPTTSAALRSLLDPSLPREGSDFSALLETIDSVIAPFSRHNGHPRFFGYVASPGVAVASAAALIEAAMNINVTGWRSGPVATEIERLTIAWLRELLGMPSGGMGLLVSGGSMANLAALAAARAVHGSGPVYATAETHFSVRKAAHLLAMGPVRVVPLSPDLRMDPAALESLILSDRAGGLSPSTVVASAGTAGTGTVDDLTAIAGVAQRHGLWFHIDGAYGALAAMAPSVRPLFAGLDRADSLSLDPHKWLYLPVGTGCVLYRDPAAAKAAFGETAEYIKVLGLEQDEAFAFWDYGPELSRPFRALPLWMLLKSVGTQALSDAIEGNLACARYFESLVDQHPDLEMLSPVQLSVFCFRYNKAPGADLDRLNEDIMLRLQKAGSSYVSNTKVNGKFALRGCVLNYRTTKRDMEILLEDVLKSVG